LLLKAHCCWAAASRLLLGLQKGRWPVGGRPHYLLLLLLVEPVQLHLCRWLLYLLLLLLLLSHLSGTPTASSPGRLHKNNTHNNSVSSLRDRQEAHAGLVDSWHLGPTHSFHRPQSNSRLANQQNTKHTSRTCVAVTGPDQHPTVHRKATWPC
jgi:hypothetical protein